MVRLGVGDETHSAHFLGPCRARCNQRSGPASHSLFWLRFCLAALANHKRWVAPEQHIYFESAAPD